MMRIINQLPSACSTLGIELATWASVLTRNRAMTSWFIGQHSTIEPCWLGYMYFYKTYLYLNISWETHLGTLTAELCFCLKNFFFIKTNLLSLAGVAQWLSVKLRTNMSLVHSQFGHIAWVEGVILS
uniref:Uncharacterized protein n=1 Tax=Myotis myotis TaxID=51298 RepID=A0A7J8AMP9_MYOMY|nr:hypothetical protein mMyoMyo1_007992 [Myotis myotis]